MYSKKQSKKDYKMIVHSDQSNFEGKKINQSKTEQTGRSQGCALRKILKQASKIQGAQYVIFHEKTKISYCSDQKAKVSCQGPLRALQELSPAWHWKRAQFIKPVSH